MYVVRRLLVVLIAAMLGPAAHATSITVSVTGTDTQGVSSYIGDTFTLSLTFDLSHNDPNSPNIPLLFPVGGGPPIFPAGTIFGSDDSPAAVVATYSIGDQSATVDVGGAAPLGGLLEIAPPLLMATGEFFKVSASGASPFQVDDSNPFSFSTLLASSPEQAATGFAEFNGPVDPSMGVFFSGSINTVSVTETPEPVPEPGSLALLGSGVFMVIRKLRRQNPPY